MKYSGVHYQRADPGSVRGGAVTVMKAAEEEERGCDNNPAPI